MTKSEARMLLMAVMAVNESGCDEMVSIDFARDYAGENNCSVYVYNKQPIYDGSEIIESFSSYDMTDEPVREMVKRIMKYRKKVQKNDTV